MNTQEPLICGSGMVLLMMYSKPETSQEALDILTNVVASPAHLNASLNNGNVRSTVGESVCKVRFLELRKST